MPFHVETAFIIDGTLYTLLAFSLVTWTLIFFKIWQFAKTNYYNKRYSTSFWNATDLNAAQQIPVEQSRGPKARIASCGFAWLAELNDPVAAASLKFRGSPQDLLEQALRKQTQDEQRRIESGLTMLASIGSTAPFVGLFGTGPIGDALIATAIGIAVAVPAVLAYNFFIRRAKHHRASLEHFVDGFLHIAFGDNSTKEKE
jgi:biopolymer transport protein ExbB